MPDDRDYIIDIRGLTVVDGGEAAPAAGGGADGPQHGVRPWIGVRWECCNTYTRIYRNAAGTHYQGHCPRCQRKATVRVGPGGTSSRFFHAK